MTKLKGPHQKQPHNLSRKHRKAKKRFDEHMKKLMANFMTPDPLYLKLIVKYQAPA